MLYSFPLSGLTDGAVDSVDPGESSLSSDMLKSIAMGGGTGGVGTDYSQHSVRRSNHVGLASADEKMAKGNFIDFCSFFTA